MKTVTTSKFALMILAIVAVTFISGCTSNSLDYGRDTAKIEQQPSATVESWNNNVTADSPVNPFSSITNMLGIMLLIMPLISIIAVLALRYNYIFP